MRKHNYARSYKWQLIANAFVNKGACSSNASLKQKKHPLIEFSQLALLPSRCLQPNHSSAPNQKQLAFQPHRISCFLAENSGESNKTHQQNVPQSLLFVPRSARKKRIQAYSTIDWIKIPQHSKCLKRNNETLPPSRLHTTGSKQLSRNNQTKAEIKKVNSTFNSVSLNKHRSTQFTKSIQRVTRSQSSYQQKYSKLKILRDSSDIKPWAQENNSVLEDLSAW